MRRALYFYNPTSGGGIGGSLLDRAIAVAQNLGWHLFPLRADSPFNLADMAVELRCERVIAAGGDGTLHHCVNRLAGTSLPVAIVPLGTSNDLAVQLGIPVRIEDAVQLALTAPPRPVESKALKLIY